jgi:hypothetical protein
LVLARYDKSVLALASPTELDRSLSDTP